MRANIVIPSEVTHGSLDLFKKPPLLVTFDQVFEQKTGPLYSPTGSSLEIEIVGDQNNFIDLQKIFLEVKCCIVQSNGNNLRYTTGDANASETPFFVNNILHTEFSHGSDATSTWLNCQGYEYESDPNTIPNATIAQRQLLVRRSIQLTLYGKVAVDFFSCEKHLICSVTIRIYFRRSQDDVVIMSEDGAKHYKVKIDEAYLFVRKMTVSDNVVGAIEKTLLKTPAVNLYNKVISKTFLATTGQQS